MKKIIILLLCCGLLVSMVGCVGNTAPPPTESPPTTVSETIIKETPTETIPPMAAVEPTEKEKESVPTESKDQATAPNVTATEPTTTAEPKEEFIACMREHGYGVKWGDKYKYITFTTPDNHVCRDKSLFDERLLKDNLEVYFALGGASCELYDDYNDYKTPAHTPEANMTVTTGLISLLGALLSTAPPEDDYDPHPAKELSTAEKLRLEKILGKKISPIAYACYSTQEEYKQGMNMVW